MQPNDNSLYRTILDAIHSPVYFVDDNLQVADRNDVAATISGQEKEAVLGRRAGELLRCFHSAKDAEGCGRAPSCESCVIRNAVKSCLDGQEVCRARMKVDFLAAAGQTQMECLITARSLPSSNERLAMLLIEDIPELSAQTSTKPGASLQQSGSIVVPNIMAGTDQHDLLQQKVVQCAACLQLTEYTDGNSYCGVCGTGLSSPVSEPYYSGQEPNLVPASYEIDYLQPTVRTIDQRRYPRIPCRNAQACIETERGSRVVVNLVNISRGGVCFTSSGEFCPGTQISIATHYIEGGHNIYQLGRIIRVQHRGSATIPGQYAVEFLSKSAAAS